MKDCQIEKIRPLRFLIFEKNRNEIIDEILASLIERPKWIIIYCCLAVFTFLLSLLVHWNLIKWMLNILTNPFVLILMAILLVLALEIPASTHVETSYDVKISNDQYKKRVYKRKISDYSKAFKWSIVCTSFISLVVAIGIYFICDYRDYYNFSLEKFYVNPERRIYHIFENCSNNYGTTQVLRGYDIDKDYVLCPNCKDISDDYIEEYERNKYRYK